MDDRTVDDTGQGGLRATGIVKRYAGVPALAGVSLTVRPGEVVGLVGHNGAGKSTLLKCLSGAVRPDEGTISVDGSPLALTGPATALAAGISTVYQELSLLPNLTVTQNVFLGKEIRRAGQLARDRMRRAARELVERFGVAVDVDRRLGDYPVATRQLLEIAIATQRGSRFLLLDEPTTSLEGEQVARLLETVGELARTTGIGVLLVNHKLDELYSVADTVVALVDGRVRIAGSAREVDRADVVRAIAGEEAAAHLLQDGRADDGDPDPGEDAATAAPVLSKTATGASAGGSPADVPESTLAAPLAGDIGASAAGDIAAPAALEVEHLVTGALRDVSLTARPGRVLGLYGLIGSGRTELLRALVGLDTVQGGSIRVDGREFRPRNPAQAARAGLVYLTEERKIDGIVPGLDSSANVNLPILHRFSRFGLLDKRAMARTSTQYMDLLRVRGNRSAPVVSLSGGNQQKVLLARALAQQPRVLLLDEPTKGVDIGVKSEIHRLLKDLAHGQGMTVVVVSSEEEEILDVADDVVTFSSGRCDGRTRPATELSVVDLRQAAWDAA